MESKTVFHVSRSTKTGKTTNVGDFDTVEQAREAMLEHYRKTPKRGQFWYTITQEDLDEIRGIVFRTLCLALSGEDKPYYGRFMADELKSLAE